MISGLIAHVSQRFCASHEETAAQTALISNHPVAAAILTDHKGPGRSHGGGSVSVAFSIYVSPNLLRGFSLGLP
jgi:hypothetical protein